MKRQERLFAWLAVLQRCNFTTTWPWHKNESASKKQKPGVRMSAAAVEPADLIDYVVKQGNGVKGLSRLGLESVPKQYIQPPEERLDRTLVVQQDSVPVIDVSSWDDPTVGDSICDAAAKWGFFQIVNHGIPIHVLENVIEAARKFFELPSEEKRKYLKENSPTHTVQLKTSFSLAEKVLEWKDFLMHFYSPDDQTVNLWPSVSRDQVLEFIKWAQPVIKKLLEVLLKGLHVKEFDEAKESMLMGALILDLMHYPKCPNPELTAGVGRHSDISSITVLLQDEVGGLYVRGASTDQWIHVTPVKGALVINIGDILQIVSNDRYKSIEHRVIVDSERDRVSVPIFVNPADDALVSTFAEVLQNGEKPVYKNFFFSEYFNFFFSKGPEGKQTMEYVKF